MLGTIVNTVAIIVGTIAGTVLHKGIKEQYKRTIFDGLGLASIAIGLNATITHMHDSQYPVLFILAIAIGAVIGARLDIDARFHNLINRYAGKGHSEGLANGLITAILLFCIGPLSMLGPVMSAIDGDNTLLFTNAALDFVSSMVFASTYGIGIMVAAPVLFLWQGLFYLVATISSQAVSDALMNELLIVGGLLIAGSGLSMLNIKDCKTLNLLPSLAVPIVWFALKALF
jgi:uncharacterized protein